MNTRCLGLSSACPWRIRKYSHKCIGAGSLVRYRRGATVRIDDSPAHTRRPPVGHHRQTPAPAEAGTDGPSWLSFIGHVKDSLWSVDLFRCDSILPRSYWVMVV